MNSLPCKQPSWTFCIQCYLIMTRQEKCAQSKFRRGVVNWSPHSEPCPVCQKCAKQKMGGRPKKSRNVPIEASPTSIPQEGCDSTKPSLASPRDESVITLATITKQVQNVAPQSNCPNSQELLSTSRFLKPRSLLTLQAFICKLCSAIVDSPIDLELHCHHLFCSKCFLRHITASGRSSCPTCYQPITTIQHIRSPSDITLMSLASLTVQCGQGQCLQYVTLGHRKEHRMSCQSDVDRQRREFLHKLAFAECTLADVLSAPVTKTPNTAEKKAVTHAVRRLINSTSELASDDFLSLKTSGQVGFSVMIHLTDILNPFMYF